MDIEMGIQKTPTIVIYGVSTSLISINLGLLPLTVYTY